MKKRIIKQAGGMTVTEITYEDSDGDTAKIASTSGQVIMKRRKKTSHRTPPGSNKAKVKITDLSPSDQAFVRALVNDQGLSMDEAIRRVSKSAGYLAKAAFDGAKASGASDEEAGKAGLLAIIKSKPEPSMEEVEARVGKSRGGWKDFQDEADLLAKQYGLPATEAFMLARKTFEPVAA